MRNPGSEWDTRTLPLFEAGAVEVPFTVGSMEETMECDTVWEAHSHPTHELLWHTAGASSVMIGDETYTITPQLGLWIPAGMSHSGFTPRGAVFSAAQFNVESTPRLAEQPVRVEVDPLLDILLRRLFDPSVQGRSRALTELMVLDVIHPAEGALQVCDPTSVLLRPIVETLRREPGNGLSLEQWASRLAVSSKTISRAFRTETGLSFARWRSLVRGQHAVAMLAAGEDTEVIALRTGYHSASAFGAAFRQLTGRTPGSFRLPVSR